MNFTIRMIFYLKKLYFIWFKHKKKKSHITTTKSPSFSFYKISNHNMIHICSFFAEDDSYLFECNIK